MSKKLSTAQQLSLAFKEYNECIELVHNHFGDREKALVWFETANPLLGNITPFQMMRLGRAAKLKAFIEDQIDPKGDLFNG